MASLTLGEALRAACRDIEGIDARLLLQNVLGVAPAWLAAHPEHELTASQAQRLRRLVRRRARGEPVAYLVGEREFYGLRFQVTPAVLIPRPETELLVDLALERIPPGRACKVLDLGSGSGAIALTLARHRPLAEVTAVDISSDALVVARLNAARLAVANVRILQGDWFEGVAGESFHLIVSNPPYVADGDPHLARGDLRFEPRAALTQGAGADGLGCLRRISRLSARHLVEGGTLLLEHGYDQAGACRELLHGASFGDVCSWPDLAGIPRVSGGRLGRFA
ncbi:peptide chain release factor N(5)-glutamine methyltransferase [Nitrosovibrio sp. Nv17]|uniref:peptide chain release factor N(5)-glutamine methyltransferase n=1 Tax=Nitrosovibrio sp. Nv17 TaxID=1855339 RepID=UPI000931B674|nr:peptide chain release factor N(5)-glutamine methyltransferase [Nitrosovibrio sp. Nv17]